MVNTLRLAPPVVSVGLYDYPADPISELVQAGIEVHAFDAGAIATELGKCQTGEYHHAGAISDYLSFLRRDAQGLHYRGLPRL